MIVITDTPLIDRFALTPAALRNAAGEYVLPSEQSMRLAAARAEPLGGTVVVQPDPGAKVKGAYPLTSYTYAATTAATLTEDQARAYADLLTYAAAEGQRLGNEMGQLPYGYVPLSSAELKQLTRASTTIVKTAGVAEELLTFSGPARVFESQEAAVEGILNGRVDAGDCVVIRYEGPRGGPGMQEMLYPTSYIKAKGLGKACALVTDGRFSGGTSGLSIGHVSPEAAGGGAIALVEEGDTIVIDIPQRRINIDVSEDELDRRRAAMIERGPSAFTPTNREREVSTALRAYAAMVTSADTGAVRDLSLLD